MIRVIDIYKNLKQILKDSNVSLVGKGLNSVNSLNKIPSEIEKLGEINKLPYVLRNEIIEVTEEDLQNITSIKDYAFDNCDNLTSIIIPDSVISIGYNALANCDNLTSIIIGNGITTIDTGALYSHKAHIYLYTTTPPTIPNQYTISSSATIHVPIGSGDTYKSATNWSGHAAQIIEDINIA